MQIQGLQKLTLLDYAGHLACTVFCHGCNFRCPFCHNASLVVPQTTAPPLLTGDDVLRWLEKRVGLLDGVCVSGGEPLLQPDLADFLHAVKELGFAVKLDTNGSFPERLQALLSAGLPDYVAMDIKNSPRRYAETAGTADALAPVQQSVALLRQGAIPYEFRTTVVRELHGPEEMRAIGEWIAGAERYFLQAFVDSDQVIAGPGRFSSYTKEQLESLADAVRPYVKQVAIRGI